MEVKVVGDGVLKDVTQVIIETTEKSPVTIAKITADFIDVAEGYRARLKPNYQNQCSLSTGGQGSLP